MDKGIDRCRTTGCIGFFWDIENCQVPSMKSVLSIVRSLREKFGIGYAETDFICVCDVTKEKPLVVEELNAAQVTVVHVDSFSKNACDEKLRAALNKFGVTHSPPGIIVLISSDVNFAQVLTDLRYRCGFEIVLIHNELVSSALLITANRNYEWKSHILTDIPDTFYSSRKWQPNQSTKLIVKNLPANAVEAKIRERLKQLSDNCGGRICSIDASTMEAVIQFASLEAATRAQHRMDSADVFGSRVSVNLQSRQAVPNGNCGGNGLKRSKKQPNRQLVPAENLRATCPISVGAEDRRRTDSEEDVVPEPPPNDPESLFECSEMTSAFERLYVDAISNGQRSCTRFWKRKSPIPDGPGECESDETNRLVDLRVDNLEETLPIPVLKHRLCNMFSEVVPVAQVTVVPQSEGGWYALVQVNSLNDARIAIQHFSRAQKLGEKEIVVGLANVFDTHIVDKETLKNRIRKVFATARCNSMALLNLLELYEQHFRQPIAIGELNRLDNGILIIEKNGTRIVRLTEKRVKNIYEPVDSRDFLLEPVSNIRLSKLGENVRRLLNQNNGSIFLKNFVPLYRSMFGDWNRTTEDGVPFEHLLNCLFGVEIVWDAPGKEKQIVLAVDHYPPRMHGVAADLQAMAGNIISILAERSRCWMPLDDLNVAYKQRFGCSIQPEKLGYSNLWHLFDKLRFAVELLGTAKKLVVCMSYRAFVRRFVGDLTHFFQMHREATPAPPLENILQISVSELTAEWHRYFGRPLSPVDYGFCVLSDLFANLPTYRFKINGDIISAERDSLKESTNNSSTNQCETSLDSGSDNSTTKRPLDRFAKEAVQLLRLSPRCRLPVARFASFWAAHFGRQLRVLDYGYSSLIELVHAANEHLQVVTDGSRQNFVTLTTALLERTLKDQLMFLVHKRPFRMLHVDRLLDDFVTTFGYEADLKSCGLRNSEEMLLKFNDILEVVNYENGGRFVKLNEGRYSQILIDQVLYLFVRCPDRSLAVWQLENEYRLEFGVDLNFNDVKDLLVDVISINQVDSSMVFAELNVVQRMALRLRRLLLLYSLEMTALELELAYYRHYGQPIGAPNNSLIGVLRMASHVLYLKGRAAKCTVCINRNFLSSLKNLKPDLYVPINALGPKSNEAKEKPLEKKENRTDGRKQTSKRAQTRGTKSLSSLERKHSTSDDLIDDCSEDSENNDSDVVSVHLDPAVLEKYRLNVFVKHASMECLSIDNGFRETAKGFPVRRRLAARFEALPRSVPQ